MLARSARQTSANGADAGQRAVDAAQDVGDADLVSGPRQFVAAFAAAMASHQAIGAQVGEDVDEKLRRYALRLGQFLGRHERAAGDRGELDHRPDRVLRLGRHPHGEDCATRRVSA
jgi:hypothetical protein